MRIPFYQFFEGVPQFKLREIVIKSGESLMNLLTKETSVFTSKSELRRLVSGGGLSINKGKISDLDKIVDESFLLNERYILVQKGKKNYFLLVVEKTN